MPKADKPGMLSLTYDLAYSQSIRDRWGLGGKAIDDILDEYDIVDPFVCQEIRVVNDALGTGGDLKRLSLTQRWMFLLTQDLLARNQNPKILW